MATPPPDDDGDSNGAALHRAETTGSAGGGSCGSSCYPKGRGRGRGGAGPAGDGGREEVVPLPPSVAQTLQRDPATIASFRGDLDTLAGWYGVVAELRLDTVALHAEGTWAQDSLRAARAELRSLLDHYDTRWSQPPQPAPPKSAPAPARPLGRRMLLRVDPEYGAGVDLTPTDDGYHVESVEEYPGQAFGPGDLIVEIGGKSLVGLSEEDLEETFGANFGDRAHLVVVSSSEGQAGPSRTHST